VLHQLAQAFLHAFHASTVSGRFSRYEFSTLTTFWKGEKV
jgi:hypothetical protein